MNYAKRNVTVTRKRKPKLTGIELAVEALEYDICDRRGLKSEWQAIDPEIISEIKAVWIETIALALKTRRKPKRKGGGDE